MSFSSILNIDINNWLENFIETFTFINEIHLDLRYYYLDFIKCSMKIYFENPNYKNWSKYEIWDAGKAIIQIENFHEINNIEITKEQSLKQFEKLKKTDGNYNSLQMYSKPILYFQWKEFYKNELKLWNTNEIINDKSIQYILYKNRLKYLGKTKEQLTNLNILQGFKIAGLSKTYSHFSPLWFKAFIEEFDISSVYDPCGGWGHRLIGASEIKYIYNDINLPVYENSKKISNFLQLKNKIFYNEDAAKLKIKETVDCMFTCPPYWNKEIYSNNGAENYTAQEFSNWWKNVIENSLLCSTKYIAFIVSKTMNDDIKYDICKNLGLLLIKEQVIGGNLNHFQRKSQNIKKGEILFVYKIK